MAQLKYRYDREIDKVERSAIRRIVERDDTPAKRMILFVSRILEQSLVYSMELSDGWYAIRTHSTDTVLSSAISKGKIVVGTKLVIQGAELMGIEEGCSPLEVRLLRFSLKGQSFIILRFNLTDAKISGLKNTREFNTSCQMAY